MERLQVKVIKDDTLVEEPNSTSSPAEPAPFPLNNHLDLPLSSCSLSLGGILTMMTASLLKQLKMFLAI